MQQTQLEAGRRGDSRRRVSGSVVANAISGHRQIDSDSIHIGRFAKAGRMRLVGTRRSRKALAVLPFASKYRIPNPIIERVPRQQTESGPEPNQKSKLPPPIPRPIASPALHHLRPIHQPPTIHQIHRPPPIPHRRIGIPACHCNEIQLTSTSQTMYQSIMRFRNRTNTEVRQGE